MRSIAIDKRHRDTENRRGNNVALLPGSAERRIHAELRGITATAISFAEWSEAVCNYYYHHASPHPLNRRRTERRSTGYGLLASAPERRTHAERRLPKILSIEASEWAEAMANYYYHFHR